MVQLYQVHSIHFGMEQNYPIGMDFVDIREPHYLRVKLNILLVDMVPLYRRDSTVATSDNKDRLWHIQNEQQKIKFKEGKKIH